MKRVFAAENPAEAHFVKGLLNAEGIEAEVRGEALLGARGIVPFTTETLPSVWILEDSQVEEALCIVARYERRELPADMKRQAWRCPKCGQVLEPQFTACWKCGADAPVDE